MAYRPSSDPLSGLGTCAPDEVEEAARAGELTAVQRGCMELSLGTASPDERDRLSLALIANSYAQGDMDSWADLVARHLGEIDATNPSLAYRYAMHELEQGRVTSAYRYSDLALANRAQWTIDNYDTKTYAAHKLRAAAAQAVWREAEAARAEGTADATDTARAKEQTGLAARAWHDFAVEAGMDADTPASLCVLSDFEC